MFTGSHVSQGVSGQADACCVSAQLRSSVCGRPSVGSVQVSGPGLATCRLLARQDTAHRQPQHTSHVSRHTSHRHNFVRGLRDCHGDAAGPEEPSVVVTTSVCWILVSPLGGPWQVAGRPGLAWPGAGHRNVGQHIPAQQRRGMRRGIKECHLWMLGTLSLPATSLPSPPAAHCPADIILTTTHTPEAACHICSGDMTGQSLHSRRYFKYLHCLQPESVCQAGHQPAGASQEPWEECFVSKSYNTASHY